MGEIWFTSDTHFGHARIAEFCSTRVFEFGMADESDVETMNAAIVERWNETVGPNDTVYHLGDLAMGKIDVSLESVSQLNGNIILILGNHDRPHPTHAKSEEKRARWAKRYAEAGVADQRIEDRISVHGVPCLLSHFPYYGDHLNFDRYPEWRPEDHGQVLIHGHVHDEWSIKDRQVNVGMDAYHGQILHYDQVSELVDEAVLN